MTDEQTLEPSNKHSISGVARGTWSLEHPRRARAVELLRGRRGCVQHAGVAGSPVDGGQNPVPGREDPGG